MCDSHKEIIELTDEDLSAVSAGAADSFVLLSEIKGECATNQNHKDT
jgi:hypothetical protein